MENQPLPSNRARSLWFFSIWGASFVFCWRTIRALAGTALTDERYTYIILIPLISACIVIGTRDIFFRKAAYCLPWGLPSFVLGLILYGLGTQMPARVPAETRTAVAVLGIAVLWIAAFTLCFGLTSLRSALFPVSFLLLMIPVPSSLLDRAISVLQEGSAATTSLLFRILGVPAIRHGLIFSLPGVDIEIAKQCSGIRSTLSLFITGILASYLVLHAAGHRIFFSLLTIPIAIFKNGVRIVTLAWLGVYVDSGFLHGKLHQYSGLPVSFLALGMLAPVIFALRKSEEASKHAHRASAARPATALSCQS